jgi:histone-lysine N-methyltransferase ASH1L
MSFDQNMIIDATTGSIARFVNHSCSPNCRMIKWIVGGQPRMALFAGDKPIMTGEELTYDYNFDPFSAKNVQKCLCGADNCRGFLGPKPREVKAPKVPVLSKEELKKASSKANKRKLQELDGDDVYDVEKASTKSFKKRKMAIATGAASSLSKGGLKVAKGAATAIKRSMSSISVSAKAALTSKKTSSPLRRVSTGGIVKKASPKKTGTTMEKAKITTTKAALSALISTGTLPAKKVTKSSQAARRSSSSASLTIVAAAPKAKTKSALSATTGNVKAKSPSSGLKVKAKSPVVKAKVLSKTPSKTPSKTSSKTPSKKTPSKNPSKRTPTASGKKAASSSKAKHSGYTPPSSPGPDDDAATPLKLSARKKVPTRKVLESSVAGTASVTKPKAKPLAQSKGKISALAKKSGFMAAVKKAVRRDTVVSASSSSSPSLPEKKEKKKGGKGKEAKRKSTDGQQEEEKENEAGSSSRPATAKGSIEAVAALSAKGFTAVSAATFAAAARKGEVSPERESRAAMDLLRANPQIRLVEA